jgi:DNA adenine methylase
VNKANQLLRWHGSKRALAPAIVALFPADYQDLVYIEPFCGSAAVFWCKKPSKAEVLNDLDEELLNFLLTVKMHPHELLRMMNLLPNSRLLFAKIMECGGRCSSVMRAAAFCYLNHTSFGGLSEHWAPQARAGKRNVLCPTPWRLYRWAVRLSKATLECAPWQEVVEKYDSSEALFYIDPPYLGTKAHRQAFGEGDWRELHARLSSLKGKFVLSAEGTPTMKLIWRGFHERLTSITSTLGPNNRRQKELLVWNY